MKVRNLETTTPRRVRSRSLHWELLMATVKEDFPRILKRLLAEKGVSRPEFAIALKVSYSTARDWLSGRILPEMSRLDDLAGYFGVNRQVFLGAPDAPKEPVDVDGALREIARAHGYRIVKDS